MKELWHNIAEDTMPTKFSKHALEAWGLLVAALIFLHFTVQDTVFSDSRWADRAVFFLIFLLTLSICLMCLINIAKANLRREEKIKELNAAIKKQESALLALAEEKTNALESAKKEKEALIALKEKERARLNEKNNALSDELQEKRREYRALDRSHKELSEENAALKKELEPLKAAEEKRQQFSRDLDGARFVPRDGGLWDV